jgi:hypothetical protein
MCQTWTEHEWRQPRFVEAGRHPTMGRYNRYVVRCNGCGRETTQTEWIDLPGTVSRALATEESAYGTR